MTPAAEVEAIKSAWAALEQAEAEAHAAAIKEMRARAALALLLAGPKANGNTPNGARIIARR
jgi:hypothetical protein